MQKEVNKQVVYATRHLKGSTLDNQTYEDKVNATQNAPTSKCIPAWNNNTPTDTYTIMQEINNKINRQEF